MIRTYGRTKTWSGVPGRHSFEVEKDGVWTVEFGTSRLVPTCNSFFRETAEITIHFESTGSFHPGCMYLRNGDPGHPPEFNEERSFVAAFIREHGAKHEVRLPDDVGLRLFEMYEEKINDVELDYAQEDDRE